MFLCTYLHFYQLPPSLIEISVDIKAILFKKVKYLKCYNDNIFFAEEIIDFRLLRSTRIENEQLDTVDYIDKTDESLTLRIAPKREKGRLVLQIGTNDPERAVKVAKMVEQGKCF